MMREPWFWRSDTMAARAVALGAAPFSLAYDLAQRARWRLTTPMAAPVPIICTGNATLGGVGKTPFAIAVRDLLAEASAGCQFLTRGYGGAQPGPLKVDPEIHSAKDVGDEALLLARHAPTWVSRDRRAGAAHAAQDGASVIIMDDGFQNPTVSKTLSILLIDAADPAGNGRIFPAGPLREPLRRAGARAGVTVFIGPNRAAATRAAEENASPFAAWLSPVGAPPPQRVVAFSGIGRPQKFFNALSAAGFELAQSLAFPDHHDFNDYDIRALNRLSAERNAQLITTEKDHVRLPAPFSDAVMTFPVVMEINQPALLTRAILSAIDRERSPE